MKYWYVTTKGKDFYESLTHIGDFISIVWNAAMKDTVIVFCREITKEEYDAIMMQPELMKAMKAMKPAQ
jgi:hypothetical protein